MTDFQFTMLAAMITIGVFFVLLTVAAGVLHIYHNITDNRRRKDELNNYHDLVNVHKMSPEEAYRKAMK